MAIDLTELMIRTTPDCLIVPVTLTGGEIVPMDHSRVSLVIQNVGSNPVWIWWKNPAAVGTGIRLSKQDTASLNAIFLNLQDHGRLVRGPIFAISETGASSVAVLDTRSERGPL